MSFNLVDLPYGHEALRPHMSQKTLEFHHNKHHRTYVNKLNELIAGTELENKSLEEIIKATVNDNTKQAIFNNAGQVFNHNIFWQSLSPDGGGNPTDTVKKMLEKSFGNMEKFTEQFKTAGLGQFGSGWVWLILEDKKIKITTTSNGDNPIAHDQILLLGLDVWEHSYYLDHQNNRDKYLDTFLKSLVNWNFAQQNLDKQG